MLFSSDNDPEYHITRTRELLEGELDIAQIEQCDTDQILINMQSSYSELSNASLQLLERVLRIYQNDCPDNPQIYTILAELTAIFASQRLCQNGVVARMEAVDTLVQLASQYLHTDYIDAYISHVAAILLAEDLARPHILQFLVCILSSIAVSQKIIAKLELLISVMQTDNNSDIQLLSRELLCKINDIRAAQAESDDSVQRKPKCQYNCNNRQSIFSLDPKDDWCKSNIMINIAGPHPHGGLIYVPFYKLKQATPTIELEPPTIAQLLHSEEWTSQLSGIRGLLYYIQRPYIQTNDKLLVLTENKQQIIQCFTSPRSVLAGETLQCINLIVFELQNIFMNWAQDNQDFIMQLVKNLTRRGVFYDVCSFACLKNIIFYSLVYIYSPDVHTSFIQTIVQCVNDKKFIKQRHLLLDIIASDILVQKLQGMAIGNEVQQIVVQTLSSTIGAAEVLTRNATRVFINLLKVLHPETHNQIAQQLSGKEKEYLHQEKYRQIVVRQAGGDVQLWMEDRYFIQQYLSYVYNLEDQNDYRYNIQQDWFVVYQCDYNKLQRKQSERC